MEKYGFNLQELRSKKEKLESLVYSTDLTDDEAEDPIIFPPDVKR